MRPNNTAEVEAEIAERAVVIGWLDTAKGLSAEWATESAKEARVIGGGGSVIGSDWSNRGLAEENISSGASPIGPSRPD